MEKLILEGFFLFSSNCILNLTNIYAAGGNMFHFDGIQRKLLLIIGAVILAMSIGLVYEGIKNHTETSRQVLSTDQPILQEQYMQAGNQEKAQPEIIQIYITGQVNRPGVYSISSDKRLIDAIELAGGCTSEADLNRINLAAKLADEGMYYVPALGEETDSVIPAVHPGGGTDTEKININQADLDQLQRLTGIGPAKAQKIIEYREVHGGFKSIEEVMNVSGIGEKTFENIKDHICIR